MTVPTFHRPVCPLPVWPLPALHRPSFHRLVCLLFTAAILAATGPSAASAQGAPWPTRPIRLVVPLPVGDEIDAIARPLAESLTKQLGQPVLLDHRPGLGGEFGAELVVRSVPDGYTFLLGSVEQAIAAAALPSPSFDLQRDLSPVTLLGAAPAVVVVDASTSPIESIADLLRISKQVTPAPSKPAAPEDQAQTSPDDTRYARLASDRLRQIIPGRGQQDGRPQPPTAEHWRATRVRVVPLIAVLPAIRDGRQRALAVTMPTRSFALPATPTLEEAGLDSLHLQVWYALWSPAGTPPAIRRAMQEHVALALDQKPMVETWNRLGLQRGGQPEQVLGLLVGSEVLNWRQPAQAAR